MKDFTEESRVMMGSVSALRKLEPSREVSPDILSNRHRSRTDAV